MSTMSASVQTLNELSLITDAASFPKNPQGYNKRTAASLIQLCFHPDRVVRLACATLPIIRDSYIVAMYLRETDSEIKAALEPRYLACMTKQDQMSQKLENQEAEIGRLRAELEQAKSKKK